ncbi:S1C family serine protease [Streptomyces globosus]|uniref:S1C family serine protease n=1 Tax=Streptomyces globosus TaxID=68209 RepID=UPI00363D1216
MSTENEGTPAPTPPAAPSAPPAAAPASETPPAPAPGAPAAQPAPPAPGTPPAPADAPPAAATAKPAAEPVTQQMPPAPASGTEHTRPVPPAPHQAPAAAAYAYPQTPAPHPGEAAHGAGGWPPPPPAVPAYGAGGGHGAGWGAFPHDGAAPAKRPGKGGLVAAVLAAALLAGGVGGGVGYWAAERNDSGFGSTTITAGNTPKDLKREPGSIAGLAAGALPSVVTLQASAGGGDGEGGTGTGFVYDQQGHILTNNHVVASAANGGRLSATFSDGKKYEAEVVGRAQGYDVAVIKLKNPPAGLKPLPLGNSDKVAVGDATIAIGAPFGLSNTVTTGIVSAKDRPVASGDGSGAKNSYMSALQTDASINPGNSGGPLLDSRGAVIGINSAIQSAGGGGLGAPAGSIGLGFAIPINQAKNVAESLIKTGKPVYPVISVSVDLQSKVDGAKISEQGAPANELVDPNGPAGKAGLRPGDIITRFGDRPIDSGPTLISEIWTHKPGDVVKLTYLREGKPSTVDITLGSRVGDK